jgi:hypothetical protein
MKKTGFVLVIAFIAIGTISAQNWGNQRGYDQSINAEAITVEGTLQLQNGQIALSAGNAVYFVPALNRYIGFIDGLKEGASVSISGYASGSFLQPAQLTIDGKSYNFQMNNFTQGYGGYGRGYCSGYAGFSGGRGMRGGCW